MTQWTGDAEVKRRMEQYGRDVHRAVVSLAERWAIDIESHAKEYAPWTDRTANARQSLYTLVHPESGKVTIYLSHGMPYGVWLELKNQGRYAIIMPTLEFYYFQIEESMRRLLR